MPLGRLGRREEQRKDVGDGKVEGRIPVTEVAKHGLGPGANLGLGSESFMERWISHMASSTRGQSRAGYSPSAKATPGGPVERRLPHTSIRWWTHAT